MAWGHKKGRDGRHARPRVALRGTAVSGAPARSVTLSTAGGFKKKRCLAGEVMRYDVVGSHGGRSSGPTVSEARIFFIFIFKKIKISKIYGGFEKFQNYTPVAPCLGDRGPVAGRQDLNVKKIHLGPGTRDALNIELIKLI